MTDTPQLLLAHHLKALRLPTFLREYDKLARQCAAEARAKPEPAPVKKAARKVKPSAAPAIETVAVEVIEQPAPGVITVTEIEETP